MNKTTTFTSKLLTFAAAIAVAALSLTASAARLGGPVVHPDSTVTFTLKAPEAQNVEVSLNYGKIKLPMTRGAQGVWTANTRPLEPELYRYWFVVDGVKTLDAANVFTQRNEDVMSSTFIVSGSPLADLYQPRADRHGSVEKVWYHSQRLGMDRRLTVYKPASYLDAPQDSFPVLYLLHGTGGDEDDWQTMGRATYMLDNLIAQGKARPMLLVMVNGNVEMQAAPGEAPGNTIKLSSDTANRYNGKMEAAFPEIVTFIDTHYRTLPQASTRAIAGLSMGGFHTLWITANNPGQFDYVGLFSPANFKRGYGRSPLYLDINAKLKRQFAAGVRLYWIGMGVNDRLKPYCDQFRALLDQQGCKHTYLESAGTHQWENWRSYLAQFLQLVFK